MNAPHTMLDREGKATKLLNRHPLMQKKKPGPLAIEDQVEPLEQANQILDLVAEGKLQTSAPTAPLPSSKKRGQLTFEEEQELAYRYHTWADLDARDRLAKSADGLAWMVANRAVSGGKYRIEDLIQEARLGALRATQTFEPARKLRFSTYAMRWIRAYVQRYRERQSKHRLAPVEGMPMQLDAKGRKYRAKLEIDSLNKPARPDENSEELGDTIESEALSAERRMEQEQTKAMVRAAIAEAAAEYAARVDPGTLPRIKVLIEERLLAVEPVPLADLGARFGVSRECMWLNEEALMKIVKAKLRQKRW